MIIHISFVAAVVFGSIQGIPNDLPNPRIHGGEDANEGEFPYLLSLQFNKSHNCGATVLSANYGLTAAHCVEDGRANPSVMAGSIHLSSPDQYREVVSYKMHPNYRVDPISKQVENDIAIIKFDSPLSLGNSVKTVQLPEPGEHTPGGTPATIVGWGLNSNNKIPDRLQKANIQVFSDEECSSFPNRPQHTICAGVSGAAIGSCTADSGGPLLVDGIQRGIVSYGIRPCGNEDVYGEVSAYIDWIKQNSDRT